MVAKKPAAKNWRRRFEDPVPLASGRALLTFRDAALHIQRLPPAEQRKLHWQNATSILIAAAEGRDFRMHARIALLQAINHGRATPAPTARRKKPRVYRVIPA